MPSIGIVPIRISAIRDLFAFTNDRISVYGYFCSIYLAAISKIIVYKLADSWSAIVVFIRINNLPTSFAYLGFLGIIFRG